jgi:alcohol dehydrogenase class IV
MAQLTGTWNYPTKMLFGPGRIAKLADACRSVGMTRPLLVTDPGLAKLPMVETAVAANNEAGLPTEVFADVKANPVGQNVSDGVERFRAGGHDGVIAFGGGSGIDAAKAIALMSGQSRPLWDFEDVGDNWTRADAAGIAPIVAVPTTAGTGSEVGRASVIVQEESHTKKIIFHPDMLPRVVVSDPELTVGLPPHITAATGMDALAHCFEAYCAPGYHPMADGIAVEGMRLVREWLPRAVTEGGDIEARANMLAAASMGATAFQKGLGAIHSLSHPIGALYDTHHGLTNAVVMPYVMAHNRPAIAERMDRLAAYIGLDQHAFAGVLDWVLQLRELLDIPPTLADLGLDDARAEEICEAAAIDPTAPTNPIPLEPKILRAMFDDALAGRIA